jgi:putative cofactor-binding repeat protein
MYSTGAEQSTDRDRGSGSNSSNDDDNHINCEQLYDSYEPRNRSKGSSYLGCATTDPVCGDRQKFKWYAEYSKIAEWGIYNFAGRVAGNTIGHGDVQLSLWLPGVHRNEVVVRNILSVELAHNLMSQSQLIDRGLRILPVNAYGIKIYNKSLAADSAGG